MLSISQKNPVTKCKANLLAMTSTDDLQSIFPWINQELFQRILISEFPTHTVKVETFTISAAVPDGENFGSQMIRAVVQYLFDSNPKEYRFVIKALQSLSVKYTTTSGLFRLLKICWQKLVTTLRWQQSKLEYGHQIMLIN